MADSSNQGRDEDKQPVQRLPVNDVLDVVVQALVISPSVGLDVKCNLGKTCRKTHQLLVSTQHITTINTKVGTPS